MEASTETFQIPLEAAEVYESKFVPALFADWAPHLVDVAGVAPGQAVLDVACGTGIVARTAAERMKGRGRVVGLDLNEAMLTVARRVRPGIEWRRGDVTETPFPDGSFDVVLCQMALMFFPDRGRALREMARVAKSDGTVALVVPASLDSQAAYGPFVEIVARHTGPEARSLLSTYWACGNVAELRQLIESAGLRITGIRTRLGTAKFDSAEDFVATEVKSTPLFERLGDDVYGRILSDAHEALRPFTRPGGALEIPLVGHLVSARKPS